MTQMRSAWRLSWDSIKLKKRLAAGAYGEVWSGILNGRYEVAVKKMLSDTSGRLTTRNFVFREHVTRNSYSSLMW